MISIKNFSSSQLANILFSLSICFFFLKITPTVGQSQSDSSVIEGHYKKLNEKNSGRLKYWKEKEKQTKPSTSDSSWVELNIYSAAIFLVDRLYEIEKDNYDQDELDERSIKLINEVRNIKGLYVVLREVLNQLNDSTSIHYQFIREKLISAISDQMKILADNQLAWYNYNTVKKKGLKGIQIKYDNDLNTFGVIQDNSDVDYTGGLEIALATDLFKINGLYPSKSYQKILYGFKVFTPLYQNFLSDSSFNVLDRPHSSFHFVGYQINGISDKEVYRWTTAFRLGVIGGRIGYNFQYYLHKDISISPYPYGWDAQIAYPGRLSLQGNAKIERLLFEKHANRKGARWGIIPSASFELALGHYMTYSELGLNISSHNFSSKNQDNILAKDLYYGGKGVSWNTGWYYNVNLKLRQVLHNTMLQGHGVFKDNENETLSFAEISRHKLSCDQIRNIVLHSSVTFGFQTSLFNFYYEYIVKSPEVDIEGAAEIDGTSINDRWHNYARLGIGFTF